MLYLALILTIGVATTAPAKAAVTEAESSEAQASVESEPTVAVTEKPLDLSLASPETGVASMQSVFSSTEQAYERVRWLGIWVPAPREYWQSDRLGFELSETRRSDARHSLFGDNAGLDAGASSGCARGPFPSTRDR